MAVFDMAAANAVLKELYKGQTVENLSYKKRPFFAMVPKDPDLGGKYFPQPIEWSGGGGATASFAYAQANQVPPLYDEFLVTYKDLFDIAQISEKLRLGASKDREAFINTAKSLIDSKINNVAQGTGLALYRNGSGCIGTISGNSTGVITLTAAADARNFERDMVIVASDSQGGTPYGNPAYVIAVNRRAGTVTTAATRGGAAADNGWGTSTYIYLHVQGNPNAMISGLQAWLPASAPSSSDNFYGVNRSKDSRLYGCYVDGSSMPIEEAITALILQIDAEGGSPDHFFCSYGSYQALINSARTKLEFHDYQGPAGIMFKGVEIVGPKGTLKVYPDRDCPPLVGFALQMDTWKLGSIDAMPHINRYGDGMEMLRVGNADASEVRVAAYGNLACKAPGWNGSVLLSQ